MKAIIGMNYGDEGKGHIVDYYASPETLVVRHNGGAQAGHAVVTSSGAEHVFHHFGSGALRGARTLLARRFILNPIIFMKELKELLDLVNMRETLIDPRCIVTTPYDMMINKYSAMLRRSHDTVGVGINETVERSRYDQLLLTARDLKERTESELVEKMQQIENEWIPFRLDELKIDSRAFKTWAVQFMSTEMEQSFVGYAKWMADRSVIWEDANTIDRFLAKGPMRNVVFEGAQGMLLDQRRKKFHPYLTRSNTGMRNINFIRDDMSKKFDMEVILVTRAYLTRHGDGPMFNDDEPYRGLGDVNNTENEYQGKMRFGALDANWFDEAIEETRQECVNDHVSVAMTCLDQVDGKQPDRAFVKFWNGGAVCVRDIKEIERISTGRTELEITELRTA